MKRKNIIDEISLKMMAASRVEVGCSEQEIIDYIDGIDDVNMKGRDGRTLLIHASTYNLITIVDHLIQMNADVNLQDNVGYTALHAAVDSKNYEIVKTLLSCGAYVNTADKFGNTPLFRASQNSKEIIEILLKNGADPTISNNYGVTPMDAFQAYPDIILMFDIAIGDTHI